jgi:hypothetical protein
MNTKQLLLLLSQSQSQTIVIQSVQSPDYSLFGIVCFGLKECLKYKMGRHRIQSLNSRHMLLFLKFQTESTKYKPTNPNLSHSFILFL